MGGVGHHNRDGVRLPPGHVRRNGGPPGRPEADDHRLVEHREPVLVDRNVCRSENQFHARHGLCRGGVERHHSGVWLSAEHHLGVELRLVPDVAGIQSPAGDFGGGVHSLVVRSEAHDAPGAADRIASTIAS